MKVSMKPLDPLEDVVFDGIRFLRSLTELYGEEKGMEVWNSMGQALGQEVQSKVLFAILTGNIGGVVKFNCIAAPPNGVQIIKCIRAYTGMGLKEAKDLWDASRMDMVKVEIDSKQRREFVTELRNLGVVIG